METDFFEKESKHARQYVENSIIVWFDPISDTNNCRIKTTEQFQTISNDVQVFNDSDACIDYITNLENERVLFIISGTENRCILTVAQELPTIITIYIFSLFGHNLPGKGSQPVRKVKGVYTDMNKLIKQIIFDIRRNENELMEFKILERSDNSLPMSRNPNKQEYEFMHSQLLKEIFLKFKDDSTSELVEYCRAVYAENPSQLAMIDEFALTYEGKKAIWWYTRDTFLYKLMNKALRTRHVETLYRMRTFIRHLHQQLTELCPVANHTQSAAILTLYRGQKMSRGDFEKVKNNEGGLLSVSNFFSTSAIQEIAYIYAGQSDDEIVAIVFMIVYDLRHTTMSSFACIEQFSQFGEAEHEWLFSMGTVFRLEKIELLSGIYHIHLKLTDDRDEVLEKLTAHMSKIIHLQRPNPLVPLCRLFARMDEYMTAVELCEKHASSENDWEMKATLQDTLALIRVEASEEILALQCHEQALNIVVNHVDGNDPLLAFYHNNVAISCSAVHQNKRAIEHYQIAIDLELSAPQPDYTNIAYSYESIGTILQYSFEKYNEAMKCYERALELMLVHLPSTHPDIVSLYNNMADIYEEQKQLEKALNMLHKCLAILEENTEYNSRDLIHTYEHIAQIYKKQQKFTEASLILNKSHELAAIYPSPKDFNLKNIDTDAVLAKIFVPQSNP